MDEEKLNERVAKLEQENINQSSLIKKLEQAIINIGEEINEIKVKLMERPSWLVMIIISTLLTACTFLATRAILQ